MPLKTTLEALENLPVPWLRKLSRAFPFQWEGPLYTVLSSRLEEAPPSRKGTPLGIQWGMRMKIDLMVGVYRSRRA